MEAKILSTLWESPVLTGKWHISLKFGNHKDWIIPDVEEEIFYNSLVGQP